MTTKAPNPVDKYVGSRVRMRRIMLGMSQETLGEALGLTFQQVQKYEKGTNRIGASRLWQIADTLGVPVESLYEGLQGKSISKADSAAQSYVSDFITTADGIAIARAWPQIGSKLRRSIVDLVEQVADREKSPRR
jgi:transcriptional regulator with XRE-family HTH domain